MIIPAPRGRRSGHGPSLLDTDDRSTTGSVTSDSGPGQGRTVAPRSGAPRRFRASVRRRSVSLQIEEGAVVMDRRNGPRPVVVGVDGSEQALRAVRWGAAEAAGRHVPLRL